jgi:hypothetical protein
VLILILTSLPNSSPSHLSHNCVHPALLLQSELLLPEVNGLTGFYKHLDNAYDISTLGHPQIQSSNVTVLPAIIALKLVLNQLEQAAAHKVYKSRATTMNVHMLTLSLHPLLR